MLGVNDWKDPTGFEAWVAIRGKLGFYKSKAYLKRLNNDVATLNIREQETLMKEWTGTPAMKWGGHSVKQSYRECLRLAGIR